MRNLPTLKFDIKNPEKAGNLAGSMEGDERRRLAVDLIALVDIDAQSMGEWGAEAQGYLDELAADNGNDAPQDREQEGSGEKPAPTTEMTLTAVIQFSARATDALLGEPDLAMSSEPGGEDLADWVSSQLRTVDENWLLDTDPLIIHMSVTGLAWRKRNFDDVDKAFHSHFIPSVGSHRVIINKNVRNASRAPRVTEEFERYPYEIDRSIERGSWVDYEPKYDEEDPQAPKKFYECDAWLDFDGDGIDEPWTVTISRDDIPEVVKIKPRWSKKTVVDSPDMLFFNAVQRFYPYRFLPNPEGGFLPMGFGKLLHRIGGSADHLLAAITDTAQSQAQNGGLMGGSSFGLPEKIELKQNRLNFVPTDGRPINEMFQPFPDKQVSPGSVQVLEKIITLGDRIAGTLNTLENAPASMSATLAKGLIDSGTQVQSAVHRRIVAAMTQELRQFVTMADAYDALPKGLSPTDGGGVMITADPQLATEMHRSALANIYMELAKDPLTKWDEVRLRLFKTLRLPNPEKLIGEPPTPQATPWEKMQGAVHLMKQKTEAIKVTGNLAVQLTTALKNMVEASGGMQDNRMALLQMAQLEHAVQSLMKEAGDASTSLDGMATQPGNPNVPQLPPPSQGGNDPTVP